MRGTGVYLEARRLVIMEWAEAISEAVRFIERWLNI